MYVCTDTHMLWHVLGDQRTRFGDWSFFSHRVIPGDPTQAVRLGAKCHYLLSHLAVPELNFDTWR